MTERGGEGDPTKLGRWTWVCNEWNYVVLDINTNDDVRDREVTKALLEVSIFKAVISNHGDKSVPATCATNKRQELINSMWTSSGLTVLKYGFLPFSSMKFIVSTLITNSFRLTSVTENYMDIILNIFTVLQCLMWSSIILASEKGVSSGSLKSMNVKMLSMIIKILLCSVRKPKKEMICETRSSTSTHPLLKRSTRFSWKLTNLWFSSSTVLSRGLHRYKSIKIELITSIASFEWKWE